MKQGNTENVLNKLLVKATGGSNFEILVPVYCTKVYGERKLKMKEVYSRCKTIKESLCIRE